MIAHENIDSTELLSLIRKGHIILGGNKRLKIYGRLNCNSGKRMQQTNRVFFAAEKEALDNGFRPCGKCMRIAYNEWKSSH